MDSTILTALIGGFATVVAGIVAVIITRMLDNPKGFKKNARQASLAGHWDGTVHQQGAPVQYHLSFLLKLTGRTFRGEGELRFSYQNKDIVLQSYLARKMASEARSPIRRYELPLGLPSHLTSLLAL